jgi:hypothetical protein
MPEGNPEYRDGLVWVAVCTGPVPPSGTEQVNVRRKDRHVARQLGKCLVPRFTLPSGGDHG